MQEDMIDFPVSDGWRDHYAAQGMTYPAGRYSKKDHSAYNAQSEIRDLKATIHTLRDQLAEIHLTEQYPHLKDTAQTPPPKPKTFDE